MAEEAGGGIIILAIIATIVALIIGVIALFLNMNWASFPIGVALVGIGLGLICICSNCWCNYRIFNSISQRICHISLMGRMGCNNP